MNIETAGGIRATERRCVVHFGVAPRPWVDWVCRNEEVPPKQVGRGEALYYDTLRPSQPRGWGNLSGQWVVEGLEDVSPAVMDMAHQLEEVGLPKCLELLDRAHFIRAVKACNLGFIGGEGAREFCQRAYAILIAGEGPSDELDALVAQIREHRQDYGITSEILENVVDFVRERSGK